MVSFLVPLERPLENFVSETSRNNKSAARSYLIPTKALVFVVVVCVCRHHQNHRRKEKKGREDDDEEDGLK